MAGEDRRNGAEMTRAAIMKRKRTLQLRCRYLAACILTAVALLMFFRPASISSAASVQGERTCKYYRSVEVPFGETFESVARANFDENCFESYRAFRGELLSINNLSICGGEVYPSVRPGDAIIVPYYDAASR